MGNDHFGCRQVSNIQMNIGEKRLLDEKLTKVAKVE
jgi:hypothetical protein